LRLTLVLRERSQLRLSRNAAMNDIDGYTDYAAITTPIDTELYEERRNRLGRTTPNPDKHRADTPANHLRQSIALASYEGIPSIYDLPTCLQVLYRHLSSSHRQPPYLIDPNLTIDPDSPSILRPNTSTSIINLGENLSDLWRS
jgi:hypothetical protein